MDKVVVVGQGYVGVPVAVRAAEVGYHVVGLDTDAARVRQLTEGEAAIESIDGARLIAVLEAGRYMASTDAADAADFDVAVIAVPTPLRDGNPDPRHIEDAARALAPRLRAGATVVLESTTYPGTTEELVVPLLEAGSGLTAGDDFHVGYSPERIDPGNPIWSFENTPKVVSGVDEASLTAVQAFYDTLVDTTVPVASPRVAELSKLLENTFRHVNIALVNELAIVANDLGIDVWQAIDAASTKPFGFMPFVPGPGVGGHCVPIDPRYLAWRVERTLGRPLRFVELANDVNDRMPAYVVSRVSAALNRMRKAVHGSRILLLGLAYKRNTGDSRGSPAVSVAEYLAALGAEVRADDPHVLHGHVSERIVRVTSTPDEVRAADLVVLLVDHDDFDYEMIAAAAAAVLDTRRRLAGPAVEYL